MSKSFRRLTMEDLVCANVELIPGIVVTVMCTIGAVGSSKFANKVEEKTLNRSAGVVLLVVSVVSLILSR